MAERVLELDNVRAGYGETVVLEDIGLVLGASETVSIIGRNGVGKTTLLATIMGHTTLHSGQISSARKGYLGSRDLSACHGGAWLCATGAGDIPLSNAARESGGRDETGCLDDGDSLRAVSASWRACRKPWQSAVWRRAANACDWARADRESERPANGRAIGGAGAGDRRGTGARGETARPDQRTGNYIGRAEFTSCARHCATRHCPGSRADCF